MTFSCFRAGHHSTESESRGADRSDFFRPIDKILGSFFFVFSGEAAKANEGQKAEYYADATADVLAVVVS